MTGGQCCSPYFGLALLADKDIAHHHLRSSMPVLYADLELSAHSFLCMRNEFASEHGRAVYPWAPKHIYGHRGLPGIWLTGSVHVCPQREAGKKSTHVWERSATPHSGFVLLPKSDCQTAKSERHVEIHASGSWTHTTFSVSAQMCDWCALVLAQLGNVQNTHLYMYVWTTEEGYWCAESKTANVFQSLSQTGKSWILLKWMKLRWSTHAEDLYLEIKYSFHKPEVWA